MDEAMREQVGRALGRIPSGCAIVTARSGEKCTGMLGSWVQQAGFEPPMISVAIRRGRPIEGLIEASGEFVINLLGEDPTAMFRHFGKGFELGQDAFAGLAVKEVACGIEIADQVARLSVRVRGRCEAGDHVIYVGEVVEASAKEAGRAYVHTRKSGWSY
ncbi:MAG TPA: flavin reductase family protein [Phycisphaerae bacterium]|nr:flavin reductase family protein [Phycisphaerae bacterium]